MAIDISDTAESEPCPPLDVSPEDTDEELSDSTLDQSPAPSQGQMLTFVAETNLPTTHGSLRVRAYRVGDSQTEPMAIIGPRVAATTPDTPVTVRVHDACFTGEVLGSLKCDCAAQLQYALQHIRRKGGVVIYLQQEGRGIGLANKIHVYSLQERGMDTVEANLALGFEADQRTYDIVPQILEDLGISRIRLMTNNPRKIEHLRRLGVEITERVPIEMDSNPHSSGYLRTKAARMGHFLPRYSPTPIPEPTFPNSTSTTSSPGSKEQSQRTPDARATADD